MCYWCFRAASKIRTEKMPRLPYPSIHPSMFLSVHLRHEVAKFHVTFVTSFVIDSSYAAKVIPLIRCYNYWLST